MISEVALLVLVLFVLAAAAETTWRIDNWLCLFICNQGKGGSGGIGDRRA